MTDTLADLVRRTPATRDRYMDFLRALSILVVVVGHWLVGIVYWQGGVIGSFSVIGQTPYVWLATWFLQVMPLFFFVGGFSNLVTYRSVHRKGGSTPHYFRTRLIRLLRPSLIFLGVWLVVQVIMHLLDLGRPTDALLRGVRPPGATIPFGPLWFLAVYVAVILASPVMIHLHDRFGLAVPIVLTVGAVVVDALAFPGGIRAARWANVAFVFLLPHQLGFLYADGRLGSQPSRRFVLMALAGLGTLLVVTNPVFGEVGKEWFSGIGHYPRSLLGTDVEPISNTYPPTIPFVAMAYWSVGVAMLARPAITRWLRRDGPWKAVVLVNSVIMTLFLWHMTAFLLAVFLLWPLGLGKQGAPSMTWWLERPIWVLVPGVILIGLVSIFGRFERPPARASLGAAEPVGGG